MRAVAPMLIACVASGLAACTETPQGAPPSASAPIADSADALSGLFTRECIAHEDMAWARQESRRIQATCGGLLVGEGEQGDCEQSVENRVSWLVPTRRGGDVLVALFWWKPADGRGEEIACSVATRSELAPMLREAAAKVADSQHLEPQAPRRNGDLDWMAPPPGRWSLRLHQRTAVETGNTLPSFDTKGQWEGRELALQRTHPAELSYNPPPDAPSPAPANAP